MKKSQVSLSVQNSRQGPKKLRAGRPRTVLALMLREMTSQYGRNPGGYIWAIFEPLGMILILSVGFALLLRAPSLGNSFILFYATGFLPFNLFLKTSRVVMNSMNYSRNLMKYPAVTWIDAVFARLFLHTLTELLVSYILLGSILIIIDSGTVLEFGPIIESFLMAAFLGLGVGLVNCTLISFVPVWLSVWNVVTRPLFLASGVIWILSDLPPVAADLLWYNPLVHITAVARIGYYPTYEPQFVRPEFVYGLSMVLVCFGLILMRRYHLDILNRR